MPEPLYVEVDWTRLEEGSPEWGSNFCLYAYLHPKHDWLLYIGKADYQTVRERLHGAHKDELFRFFWKKYRIDWVEVIQGDLLPEQGRRRSSELLSHVESLLIMRLQPPANIVSTRSRAYRPGLRVRCLGDWPLKRAGFRDWD
jgi:hypothetical protein